MTPFLVAEVGANHHGSLSRALRLVELAAAAGADAVKFQCWSPGTMVLSGLARYEGQGPWQGQRLRDLYEQCFTPWAWFPALIKAGHDVGVDVFASAFDRAAVDFLERHKVLVHKIASFELVDLELIRYAAATGKPLILSTGMANSREIDEAVAAAVGASRVTLLRCVSGYPARPEESNLSLLPTMQQRWPQCDIGLSDHTLTDTAAVLATALGASIIEKHFIGSRADGGPDVAFSLEPTEFHRLVCAVREAAAIIGADDASFGPQESEKAHVALRRSLYWSQDLPEGHIIVAGDMTTARPALGLPPRWKPELLGRKTLVAVQAGSAVTIRCLDVPSTEPATE